MVMTMIVDREQLAMHNERRALGQSSEPAVDGSVAIVIDDVEGLSRRRVEAIEQGYVEGCSSQVDVPADFELIGMVVVSEPNIEMCMTM